MITTALAALLAPVLVSGLVTGAPSPTPPPTDSADTWESVAIVLGFLVLASIGIWFLIRAGMRQGDRERLDSDD